MVNLFRRQGQDVINKIAIDSRDQVYFVGSTASDYYSSNAQSIQHLIILIFSILITIMTMVALWADLLPIM